MTGIAAVIFDVGRVLYHWNPRILYERLIPDDQALDAFLRDVVSEQWHFQHDLGRPFSDTSAELIARFPDDAPLIRLWGQRFNDSVGPAIDGMADLVADLDDAGVPLFAITNYSHEFWPPFVEREAAMFAPFRDIVVSGVERLAKPDPAIFHLALDRFGLTAKEAIFIDDRADNVDGARAVGMRGHVFTDAPTLRAELESLGLLA
ncbi:HAD family phosphatase [Sphingobium sp. AN641]|uniref:HAD family hydrolase n=1 Tax=Sphingobium sp. AN641 TaxID=3133443 RepID=UPI0030C0C686